MFAVFTGGRGQESVVSDTVRHEHNIHKDTARGGIEYYYRLREAVMKLRLKMEQDSLSFTAEDSIILMDSLPKETMVPLKFVGYDINIYRNSKANIRKSLLASTNPPLRENMDNWFLFVWCFVLILLIIAFKYIYPLQYYLINRAWYSSLGFREFYDTQTDVFKGSKFYAWFLISQIFSLGVFALIRVNSIDTGYSDIILAAIVSGVVISVFILNQWSKFIFAYAFKQVSLSKDYAIIFRVNSYLVALVLLPTILFVYFTNQPAIQQSIGFILLISLLIIYGLSLIKFSFSGLFAETQSSIFLILYLCAFEVLPILVLVKSFNSFLF